MREGAAILTSEYLVEEDFDVVGGERLRRHDDLVQVALHQLSHYVAIVMVKETLVPEHICSFDGFD